MKKYYSNLQLILIVVLMSTTAYSIYEYNFFLSNKNSVNLKVIKRNCINETSFIIKKARKDNYSSVLVNYKGKGYRINYNYKDCIEVGQSVKLFYDKAQDKFYFTDFNVKNKLFFFISITILSLLPFKILLESKKKGKEKKKKGKAFD